MEMQARDASKSIITVPISLFAYTKHRTDQPHIALVHVIAIYDRYGTRLRYIFFSRERENDFLNCPNSTIQLDLIQAESCCLEESTRSTKSCAAFFMTRLHLPTLNLRTISFSLEKCTVIHSSHPFYIISLLTLPQ